MTFLRLHDRKSGDPCLVRADTVVFVWSDQLAVDGKPIATLRIDNGHQCTEAAVLESIEHVQDALVVAGHRVIVDGPKGDEKEPEAPEEPSLQGRATSHQHGDTQKAPTWGDDK